MYRQAVRLSGPRPQGNMGMAFAAAVLDHGFVGIASHLNMVREVPHEGASIRRCLLTT